jgi:hypothetical protein
MLMSMSVATAEVVLEDKRRTAEAKMQLSSSSMPAMRKSVKASRLPWLLLIAASTIGAGAIVSSRNHGEGREGQVIGLLYDGPQSVTRLLRRGLIIEDGPVEETEFCPACLWLDGSSCEDRKQQMMDRYFIDEEEAIAYLNQPVDGEPSPCLNGVLLLTLAEDEEVGTVTGNNVEEEEFIDTKEEVDILAKVSIEEEAEENDPEILEAYRAIFCDECSWHAKITCGARKQFLFDTYGTPELVGMQSALERENCLKEGAELLETAKEVESLEEEEARAEADIVELAEENDPELLEAYRAIFCDECSWHANSTCGARVKWLFDVYGTPEMGGMQSALEMGDGKCLKEGAELPTTKKEAIFCESCTWAAGIKCRHRVQFLMEKLKFSEKEGMDHAMLEGKCTEVDSGTNSN